MGTQLKAVQAAAGAVVEESGRLSAVLQECCQLCVHMHIHVAASPQGQDAVYGRAHPPVCSPFPEDRQQLWCLSGWLRMKSAERRRTRRQQRWWCVGAGRPWQ